MFEIFYQTFLETTDPDTEYIDLASPNVALSIGVNLVLYTAVYFLLVYLFGLQSKPLFVLIALIVIMVLGYIARLARTKSIYTELVKTNNPKIAREKTMSTIRNAYFTWYFLA